MFLIDSRERERRGERKEKIDVRSINWLPHAGVQPGIKTSPGYVPNLELNLRPSSAQNNSPTTESHFPGLFSIFQISSV